VLKLLDYWLQWKKDKHLDEHSAAWLYAILSRLSTPIHSETAGKLRSVLYQCCEQRYALGQFNQQVEKEKQEKERDEKEEKKEGGESATSLLSKEENGAIFDTMEVDSKTHALLGGEREGEKMEEEGKEDDKYKTKAKEKEVGGGDAMEGVEESPNGDLEEGEISSISSTPSLIGGGGGKQKEEGELEEGEVLDEPVFTEGLAELNILITLISKFFGQKEDIS